MTKIEEVLEYVRSNTHATNKEISEDLKIGDGVVRVYMDDFREIKVINEKIRVGELIIRLVDKL